mgnify:CR=1 FL=1
MECPDTIEHSPCHSCNLFLEHGLFLLGGRILREHGGAGGTKPRNLTPADVMSTAGYFRISDDTAAVA